MTSATSSFWTQMKTLWALVATRITGESHQDRLESFYRAQAGGYDAFRARLLHGRQDMIDAIPPVADGVWVDLGAGTGENAERFGERLASMRQAYLVDLCPSLLEVCQQRISSHGWTNVTGAHADATKFTPAEGQCDIVTCSYSLTMIPDWFAAIENAYRLLKPGGVIGIVDFYVTRKHPEEGLGKHSGWTRSFWPWWFAHDNVFLSPDHLPFLRSRFETILLREERGKVPFMPGCRAPYYIFIGRKPTGGSGEVPPELHGESTK